MSDFCISLQKDILCNWFFSQEVVWHKPLVNAKLDKKKKEKENLVFLHVLSTWDI